MQLFRFRHILIAAILMFAAVAKGDQLSDRAQAILSETGVRGGFIAHIGCGDGKLTAAFRVNDSYQVQGLAFSAEETAAARANVDATGVYGDVCIDTLRGDDLPYITNTVNLVVAELSDTIDLDEVLRVVTPGGAAYVKDGEEWKTVRKPRSDKIDEWTHYMHDPSNNAVAHDDLVGPPRHLQWVGTPKWSRHHDRMASLSAMVSSGGRVFYIMDEGSRVSIQMPPRWKLIARDAFNGVILWKRDIPTWHNHLWPLKSGPTQLARRLVAVGNTVYCTLGLAAPVSAIDAATGETIRTFEGTEGAEEVVVADGMTYVLVNNGKSELADYKPELNVGDQGRVAKQYRWNEAPRFVMAFDEKTGELKWKRQSPVAPLTLSTDASRIFFHDGEKVVALDRKTGDEQWTTTPAARRQWITMNFGPKMVVYENVVLFAGGDRTMRAYDANTGKQIWDAPHAQSGYQSPEDLLVSNGLVWCAPTTSGRDTGVFTGRDPHTGEVKKEFPPDVETYWFHHRCYIAKATDKYILPSRTGIEFVNPDEKHWDINHWVRGGCLYGVMPCNGLVYAPPHNCACYTEAKLFGLNALAPTAVERKYRTDPVEMRYEKGPAFGNVKALPLGENDWPTYRHDETRSGSTPESIAASPTSDWSLNLGGRLSTATIAEGKLFIAQIDKHTLHAIDAANGDKLWKFTAGGRIDSPPTYHQGAVIFGSADGWIYSVRASDGELVWKFRGAPADRRLMAYEQLESVWPVHGSVLVKNDSVYAVAGRSNFLDGGLRFLRLNVETGELISESNIDSRDPQTGENLQVRLQTLQMPVGLPDILSAKGDAIFMRSQEFNAEGERLNLGPHSGNAPSQGAVQKGNAAHLFAPTGFLDDTYFHRSYWVYGRSFAGGHNGYYQAGKNAPGGRIAVFDDERIYAFGRNPEYLRWTTILEHQLFSAAREQTEATEDKAAPTVTASGPSVVRIATPAKLNPAGKPLTVAAWVRADKPNGVVIARGGPADGFALSVMKGKPQFDYRADSQLATIAGDAALGGKWTHLAAVVQGDGQMALYANGRKIAEGKTEKLMSNDPKQPMEIGADEQSSVGEYTAPAAFTGAIDEVAVFYRDLSDEEIVDLADEAPAADSKGLVLSLTFDRGKARDFSPLANKTTMFGVKATAGKTENGMLFSGKTGKGGGNNAAYSVKRDWSSDVALFARGMLLADKTIFVVGPPDTINEAETFKQLSERDPKVQKLLETQEAALDGEDGGRLIAVDAASGEKLAESRIDGLPVWDGLLAAGGRLYIITTDGRILSFR